MEKRSLAAVAEKLTQNVTIAGEINSHIGTLNQTIDTLLNTLVDTLDQTHLKQIQTLSEQVRENLVGVGTFYEKVNQEYEKTIAVNSQQMQSIKRRDEVIENLQKDIAAHIDQNVTNELRIIKALLSQKASVSEGLESEAKAFITELNNTLYFANPLDDGQLYEMDQSGLGLRKIGKKQFPKHMKIYKDSLYFINKHDKALHVVRGKEIQCICSKACQYFYCHEEKIYVRSQEGIYSIDLKGYGETCLYQGEVDQMDVIQDQIYFVSDPFLYVLDLKTHVTRQVI